MLYRNVGMFDSRWRTAFMRVTESAAWLAIALVIAVYLGPWLSDYVGVALPAFAMVRTTRRVS